jgi:hypothetical protein
VLLELSVKYPVCKPTGVELGAHIRRLTRTKHGQHAFIVNKMWTKLYLTESKLWIESVPCRTKLFLRRTDIYLYFLQHCAYVSVSDLRRRAYMSISVLWGRGYMSSVSNLWRRAYMSVSCMLLCLTCAIVLIGIFIMWYSVYWSSNLWESVKGCVRHVK